jgi:hypothetical protein
MTKRRRKQYLIAITAVIVVLLLTNITFAISHFSSTPLISATFANPNNPNCPYSSSVIAAPTERQMETAVSFELSNNEQTQFVDLLLPATRSVILTTGRILPMSELNISDAVYMSGGRIGIVQSVEQREYIPQPAQTDENGNVYQRVIGTSRRHVEEILYLYTDDDLIKTPPEHPFYVDGVWVEAQDLQPGDGILARSGETVTVVRTEIRHDPQMVYNLLVEGSHNFYVGSQGLLAHNCTPTPEEIDAILKQYPPTSGQCTQCANEVYALFDNAGIDADIGYMETDAPFLTTRDNIQLSVRRSSDLAYHEFVRVGDTIYDSLTGPHGMSWADYQNLFYAGVFTDGTIRVTFYKPGE